MATKNLIEVTYSDLDDLEYVGSVMEVMACMATNDTIETGHVANVAADCSGKLKKVIQGIYQRKEEKENA